MIRTIRKGTFETNSSSTHALVVPKKVDTNKYDLYTSWEYNYNFDRCESRLCDALDEKLAYAYILLKDYNVNDEDMEAFKKTVKKLWQEIAGQINYRANSVVDNVFKLVDDDPYLNHIDNSHGFDDPELIERLLHDEAFLKRFLFNGGGYVTLGGDEYRGFNIKTIGFEYDYGNDDDLFWSKLEEYKKENDVYLKGE